ncbi:MAG: sigma-70 family RNA polymerase sigma factor [Saprospiraceae bacterium]|nr:sigma-70 family RNA polymerase sigma factor [Saprospiraceae bacterium]
MADNNDQAVIKATQTYGKRLFQFIRNRVPTNADAEDILQDVWYQLSNVVDLGSIEQLSSWLFRVARNRVTDTYRKKKTESLEHLLDPDDESTAFLPEILFSEDESLEVSSLRSLFWEELFAALDELPDNQREIFVLNELEDETFQSISDRTGVNIKTLISRKRYAVIHVRERLRSLYEEFLQN